MNKRMLVGWFLALVACGRSIGAELSLLGPNVSQPNVITRYDVIGLPTADIEKPFKEQIKWLSSTNFLINSPDDSPAVLRQKFEVQVVAPDIKLVFFLEFSASKPGEYVIIVDKNDNPTGLATLRVRVGDGTVNPPDPTPNPNPPVGKVSVGVVVRESAEQTEQMARIFNSPKLLDWLKKNQVEWVVIDPQQNNPYVKITKKMPELILDSDKNPVNGVLYQELFPDSVDKVLEILGKYRGN